jgi:hypothetical protein
MYTLHPHEMLLTMCLPPGANAEEIWIYEADVLVDSLGSHAAVGARQTIQLCIYQQCDTHSASGECGPQVIVTPKFKGMFSLRRVACTAAHIICQGEEKHWCTLKFLKPLHIPGTNNNNNKTSAGGGKNSSPLTSACGAFWLGINAGFYRNSGLRVSMHGIEPSISKTATGLGAQENRLSHLVSSTMRYDVALDRKSISDGVPPSIIHFDTASKDDKMALQPHMWMDRDIAVLAFHTGFHKRLFHALETNALRRKQLNFRLACNLTTKLN